MVPFWVPNIIRHLLFRVPKKGTLILTTTHINNSGFAAQTPEPETLPMEIFRQVVSADQPGRFLCGSSKLRDLKTISTGMIRITSPYLKDQMTLKSRGPSQLYYESL